MDSLMQVGMLTCVIVACLMGSVWVLSLLMKDVSIVDRVWGLGFVFIAVSTAMVGEGFIGRKALMLSLVCLWGLRLSAYITWRNWGRGEDYRYGAMREFYGKSFPYISLVTVFGIQGVLMWFISMPVQVVMVEPSPDYFTSFDTLGTALWAVGFFFETVGDWQLTRFKKDPASAGKVMDRGLWRYTRHPNYFGDCMQWWGVYLVACSTPEGAWSLLSPVLMTLLLLRVSGVALLERHLHHSRPDYRHYVETTNAFFPGWPGRPWEGE